MDVTTDEPMSGADAMEALKSAGVLDDVLAKIDAGQLQLTGEGGFLPEMVKAVLERGLAAELTDHLPGGIVASIVHQDDFPGKPVFFHDPPDPMDQFRQGLLFIKERNDNGDVHK